jgi:hypothetical protein
VKKQASSENAGRPNSGLLNAIRIVNELLASGELKPDSRGFVRYKAYRFKVSASATGSRYRDTGTEIAPAKKIKRKHKKAASLSQPKKKLANRRVVAYAVEGKLVSVDNAPSHARAKKHKGSSMSVLSGSGWNDTKNAIRCRLIVKKVDGTISAQERRELAKLTSELRKHRDQVAPVDADIDFSKLPPELRERLNAALRLQ